MKFLNLVAFLLVYSPSANAFTSPSRITPNVNSNRPLQLLSKSQVSQNFARYTPGAHIEKCHWCLYSSKIDDGKASGQPEGDSAMKSLASASLLVTLDVFFRKLFQRLAISFPSSLGGCCALFVFLLTFPKGENAFNVLSPGSKMLAKWLPVFFVPSLVLLPLTFGSIGSSLEILKMFIVVLGGFYFSLLSTAGSVVGVKSLVSPEIDTGVMEDADEESKGPEAAAASPPPKPFSDQLSKWLRILTLSNGFFAIALGTIKHGLSGPLSTLFMLSATLHNFVFGARLPKKFTKVVHPLVTCTLLTWATANAFAIATRSKFFSVLQAYKTGALGATAGAGDILLFLLGPAVVSLAVSMYDRRKLMRENLLEVFTAVGVSSVGGLFGTAAIVRLLRIANPYLRLSLLSRNITSPLAMSIATILGADVSLAVSMVVVTGLIGANFGARILDAFGVRDAVARGLGIGAAAHGLGTAAFVNEKDAFPFAAISMALTATACTCLVSVPVIKNILVNLALGGV